MNDAAAASLRGFGPLGILAMLIILMTGNIILPDLLVIPLGAVLVLLWAWLSQTPWSAIGYVRPKNWALSIAIGITSGIFFKLAMKSIVMPLLGADPVNHAYHFLAGNRALLPNAIWAMCVAGFAEETVFRGYLFERLGKWLGTSSAAAKIAIVLLTSMLFGAAHYTSQGVPGVEQATIVGLVFGSIFAVTGRVFTLMLAHAAFDLTALALIYFDVERAAAHLVFTVK